MTNAKTYLILIAVSLLIGATISYALTNKTIEQQIEEQNTAILQDCLSKARVKTLPSEILEYASHCNKDLLKTIQSPLYSRTGATMNATGSKVPEPLGFQLIPQASAKEHTTVNVGIAVGTGSEQDEIVHITEKIRTPKQIYEQVNCNTECKIETITKLGINSNIAKLIVSECKEGAIDPVHCIIVASSIVINESGGGKSNACVNRFNCFGFGGGKIKYTSYQESVANFVNTYSRKWYKAKNSSFFYPDKGEYSPSRYCVSEQSSNSEIGCPFGQKHMQNTWNKLEKLF